MAEIRFKRAEPLPESLPVESVVIELTVDEAKELGRILFSYAPCGYGVTRLYNDLKREVGLAGRI